MKQQKTFIFFLIFLLGIFLNAQNTQIEMNLWNRYTMNIANGIISKNNFSLARGYFRINHKFNDNVSGRFNIDLFSTDDFNDGAGIKLKYAYLKFKTKAHSNIYFGLTKTYFGTIYSWDYIIIDKALEDKNGVISSSDYGIVYEQELPTKIGKIYLQMANGEGYKSADDNVNINPACLINIKLNPLKIFSISVSGIYEKSGILDTVKTIYDKRTAYSINGKVSLKFFEMLFQWLSNKKGNIQSQGYIIVPIIRLNDLIHKDIELVGKYENYDNDIATNNNSYSMFTGGINYYFLHGSHNKPAVMLQVNGAKTVNEDGSHEDNFSVQFRWEFKSIINN